MASGPAASRTESTCAALNRLNVGPAPRPVLSHFQRSAFRPGYHERAWALFPIRQKLRPQLELIDPRLGRRFRMIHSIPSEHDRDRMRIAGDRRDVGRFQWLAEGKKAD